MATTTVTFDAPNPTVFGEPAPTAVPSSSLPIGPIVGGTCAGVLLALLAVCGWKSWGRQIRRQHHRDLEKRRRRLAALTYRRSVTASASASISGTSRPSSVPPATVTEPSDEKANQFPHPVPPLPPLPPLPVERNVKFAILNPTSSNSNAAPVFPAAAISSPKALRSKEPHPTPPVRTAAKPLAVNRRLYHPVQPSPLLLGEHRPATTAPHSPTILDPEKSAENTAVTRSILAPPRARSNLSSLRRQSKASQHSGSDQSRQSTAESYATRWSWRALLTGPGFSLTQLGIGSGRNRLSTDSSSLAAWPEIDIPGEPVGYAFSTVDSEGEDHTQQGQLRPKKK